jgi:hypothetical protein
LRGKVNRIFHDAIRDLEEREFSVTRTFFIPEKATGRGNQKLTMQKRQNLGNLIAVSL